MIISPKFLEEYIWWFDVIVCWSLCTKHTHSHIHTHIHTQIYIYTQRLMLTHPHFLSHTHTYSQTVNVMWYNCVYDKDLIYVLTWYICVRNKYTWDNSIIMLFMLQPNMNWCEIYFYRIWGLFSSHTSYYVRSLQGDQSVDVPHSCTIVGNNIWLNINNACS